MSVPVYGWLAVPRKGHAITWYVPAAGLPKLTRATITAPSGLARALDSVRSSGWAGEQEEAVIGEASVAAPIFDRRGVAAGAIGVVGPVERISKGRSPRPELITHVRDAARAISRDLGGGRY